MLAMPKNRTAARKWKELKAACRSCHRWIELLRLGQTGPEDVEAEMRVKVGATAEYPELMAAQFRITITWKGESGAERLDTWDPYVMKY